MSEQWTTVHKPIQEYHLYPFQPFFKLIKNTISSRELVGQLFKRDFFGIYKKSLLGAAWIFISPVVAIVSWLFMNLTGVLNPGDVGIPYPAYVLISTSIWVLFKGFFDSGSQTLNAGRGFINQVSYPHEVLIIKNLAQQLAIFFLSFILNIIVLIFFGVIPHWQTVLIPFAFLPLFFLGGGFGLLMSVFMCVSEDTKKVTDILISLLMFITPVIYSSKPDNALLAKIIYWNPLTYLIGMPRDLIVYGRVDYLPEYGLSVLASFIIFLLGLRFFYSAEPKVIEKMI